MLISVRLLTKYVKKIYVLGSVHEKFGVWIKAVPKSLQRRNSRPGQAKWTAEPFQIETGVPSWFRDRTFQVLNSMYYVRRLNRARYVVTNPRNLKSRIFFWIIPTKRTLKLLSANSDQQRYFSQNCQYIIKGKGYEYLKNDHQRENAGLLMKFSHPTL